MDNQILRVAIVGPESTGKTTLAQGLAAHLQTNWVPEFARQYLEELGRDYVQADLVTIAKGQLQTEDKKSQDASRYLICDTNLLVIKIWSEYKYGAMDPWIEDRMLERSYDLYLLTACDVPWEYDEQRENPLDRKILFERYLDFLKHRDLPFHVLAGNREERLKAALQIISDL